MHPNPVYHSYGRKENLAFARQRGFGVLAAQGDGAPLLSHVPFVLDKEGRSAELHLMRSNPIARAAKFPIPARIAVSGPHGYVSPDWYGMEDQVPTWNYVAVHLTGTLEPMPQEEIAGVLDRLSDHFEAFLTPKPIWKMSKMPQEVLDRLMRMIVPFRLVVEEVDGTWKLAQNKPEEARLAAAGELEKTGFGAELQNLAELMRNWQAT